MATRLVIIPTIDVEGTHGSRPFEQLVFGEVGADGPWGVEKISNIFHRHGVIGTFFVDVYEYTLWGTAPLDKLCNVLVELGQDVQLHTHPSWRDDPRDFQWIRDLKRTKSFLSQEKDFMAKLSLQEQVHVLQHGKDLLCKWAGVQPIAHRSGGYSVDDNTMLALQQSGFKVDSSQNRANTKSKVYWTYNALSEKNRILEIPLTLYDRCFWTFGPRIKGTFRRLKTSLQSLETELVHFCEYALERGLPVMNLFMHSYSLLKMDEEFTKIGPNPKAAECLGGILRWGQKKPGVEIMSVKQYYESSLWQGFLSPNPSDTIPRFSNGRQLIVDLFGKIHRSLG